MRMDSHLNVRHRSALGQRGQAVAEALVALFALAALWLASSWLARVQDLALNLDHATRYRAFLSARHSGLEGGTDVNERFFYDASDQWSTLKGDAVLASRYAPVDWAVLSGHPVPEQARIGGDAPAASRLRHEWRIGDAGLVRARAALSPYVPAASLDHDLTAEGAYPPGLLRAGFFDAMWPRIQRHTAIAVGAGHSASDEAAASRVALSAYAWGEPAERSYRLGQRVASAASGVDAAWNRAAPLFDWLQPWAGDLPSRHVSTAP